MKKIRFKKSKTIIPKNFIIIKNLWEEFEVKRKRQLFVLLLLMFLSGISEIFSLATLVPFLIILTNPEKLIEIKYSKFLIDFFGIDSAQKLLIPITIIFLFAALLAAAIKLLNIWANGQIASSIGHDLSKNAYFKILGQPYRKHLETNTGSIISSLTTDIGKTVGVINTSLEILTSLSIVISILLTLFFINSSIAIFLLFVFGFSYLIIAKKAQKQLSRNSKISVIKSKEQIKFLQEGLGAIRDILIDSNQLFYLNLHKKTDLPIRNIQVQNTFLRRYPRYTLEAIGIVFIATIGLILSLSNNSILIIPTLGTIALGAQRLLPALQNIYASWATINAYIGGVESVLEILNLKNQVYINQGVVPHKFKNSIEFKNLGFSYSNNKFIFNNLNFTIKKGEIIGIVGKTGSGKSTFLDLLIGLLIPTKGQILIDGIDLHNESNKICPSWMKAIGHVPQNIFLSDSSIAENIAFGIPTREIDLRRVEKVARQAQLISFIEGHPDGYQRLIGEKGSKLSGGQRQRLGIARALYKQSEILILDEATSALDNKTESLLIKEINRISKNLTVIMIAHRLSTLDNCDKVIEIKDGEIIN